MAITVRITQALKYSLQCSAIDENIFIEKFTAWKLSADEYGSYLFGKDSAYIKPDVDGKSYVLRHVHLPPLADEGQLRLWNKKWQQRSRKTSDRVLIYVEDNRGNYLLIFILPEPIAHAIAKMQTLEHQQIMNGFASVAAQFLDTGEVIA